MLNPGKATALSTPGCLRPMSDMRRMTASVRSSEAAVRQLGEGDKVLLVLGGHEAGGNLVEAPAGQSHQPAINHQRHGAFPQDTADPGGVFVARPGEDPVERPEEPAQGLLHEPGKPVLGRVMVLEQHGAQRRGKGQRIERRNDRRDGDRDGELLVELAGQAR